MTGPVRLPSVQRPLPHVRCMRQRDRPRRLLLLRSVRPGLRRRHGRHDRYYYTPDAKPCGARCRNPWHGSPSLGPYDCTPCQLPTGHKAAHWTACRPSPKETS